MSEEASKRAEEEADTPDLGGQSDDSSDEGDASGDTEMDFLRSLFSRTLGLSPGEKVLDELTLDGVARYILSGKCELTSQMSPVFKSEVSVCDSEEKLQPHYLLSKRTQAKFFIVSFQIHPEPFFALARELYPGQFKPTVCHYFMRMLKDKGLLTRSFSQNIDTLERVAGLEGEDLIEAHGTFHTSHCVSFLCRKEYSMDWMKNKIFSEDIPKCDSCGSLVKPDIVFFGENLPDRFFTSMKMDFPRCDLLIIMGTSLQVQPFASLVKFGMGLIGFGGGMDFDSDKAYRDVAHLSTCDDGCMALAELLGWKEELEQMVKREHALIDSRDVKKKDEANQNSKSTGAEAGKTDKTA
uniref:NAD-dependent protein deacetylase sirtuin-2 n=1 Tax=Sinocyclocheilus anshuiensis TaxID=1608454 RepID=A0A671KMT9_9TELE